MHRGLSKTWTRHPGFNRDPHFQRVMQAAKHLDGTGFNSFNRDPHFQRVMRPCSAIGGVGDRAASIGTLIFRG